MRICAYAHTNPPYHFSMYIRTFVIPNPTQSQPHTTAFFRKYTANNRQIQKNSSYDKQSSQSQTVLHTLKNQLLQLIYCGKNMTNHVTISIPKREKPVWDAWKKYPANKNTSAALMRLVRNDLRTWRGE